MIDRFGYNVPDRLQVKSACDWNEVIAKTKIWIQTKAPEESVKSALGLNSLSDEELRKAPTLQI
ncbi:hypothetical protein PsorP6_009812 [Peronosclerospora sorghi]|uniref:Uncharacterized protein n=1 Tax=Peronosclerospora sorghi TaxID=230839 RepID=A0ACC0VYN9_9STRA|nr:hypothetical protein PsorP6_009812 [Peronosclerospora sorghi]